jgi:hypothetical protein
MRARAVLALLAAMALALAVAGPAAAKGEIAEANITGPGLGGGSGAVGGGGGGMRIDAPATDGLWASGFMDDKSDSVSDFGLVPADLGPRYLVTYRFDFGPGAHNDLIHQELYPYAKSGPVTYTPPGQQITGQEMSASMPPGWFRPPADFLDYLVARGLPATNPLATAGDRGPATSPAADAPSSARPAPWAWILVGIVGIAAVVSLAAPRVRRRVLSAAGVNH